tara:strand:+ start:622 stop:828 length:207 start_codon:yes stop_codon:yes gene_type:complete
MFSNIKSDERLKRTAVSNNLFICFSCLVEIKKSLKFLHAAKKAVDERINLKSIDSTGKDKTTIGKSIR